jgi:hypothetical protein
VPPFSALSSLRRGKQQMALRQRPAALPRRLATAVLMVLASLLAFAPTMVAAERRRVSLNAPFRLPLYFPRPKAVSDPRVRKSLVSPSAPHPLGLPTLNLSLGHMHNRVPKVLWAQRRPLLYLRVVIPGLARDSLRVT